MVMAALSVEDKTKGKRIITQFFRTMPVVQKSLMSVFEKDGYEGVFRIQSILYPSNSSPIDSTDALRKALSMILQHIYGMPVEDKEGYFQEVLKCKTANQVVRKEKETLINFLYTDLPGLKEYLKTILLEDANFRLVNGLRQKFLGEGEEITDMRSFKNQIRNLHEAIKEQISSGTPEDVMLGTIKEYKAGFGAQPAPQEAEAQLAEGPAAATPSSDKQAEEKKRIIVTMLGDEKYKAIREVLLNKVIVDPNFATLQVYLDNILSPSARLITNDMKTFSQGIQKIKEFRDNLEKELVQS
jgi:hypothetical protein